MTDTLLRTTSSLCGSCKRSLPAELWRAGDTVVMRKQCPEHGVQQALIAARAAWYDEVMS